MSLETLSRRAGPNVVRSILVLLVAVPVLLVAACSSSGSSSGGSAAPASSSSSAAAPSPSPSASAAVCADVTALRESVQELTSIRPGTGAVDQLRTAVQKVQSNLSTLSGAAGDLWSGPIQNLRSALTKLQSAVSTLASQRNASSVSGVVTAIGGVSAAARQLFDAASVRCPSASASASA
jgi:hypothetical protein